VRVAAGSGTTYGSDQTFTSLASSTTLAIATEYFTKWWTLAWLILKVWWPPVATAPYTWTITSATLPHGLSLSASGGYCRHSPRQLSGQIPLIVPGAGQ